MNENEFEYNGKMYVAERGVDCTTCAMDAEDTCYAAPQCTPAERKDNRDVIFVEKQS